MVATYAKCEYCSVIGLDGIGRVTHFKADIDRYVHMHVQPSSIMFSLGRVTFKKVLFLTAHG